MTRRFFAILGIFVLAGAVAEPFGVMKAATETTGKFEVYCDGFGIFLRGVDGAPEPGNLALFSLMHFPPNLAGGLELARENWIEISVYPGRCLPDGKCQPIGKGKIWLDPWDTSNSGNAAPRHISGKYEIELSGKELQATFEAKLFSRKKPVRLCM